VSSGAGTPQSAPGGPPHPHLPPPVTMATSLVKQHSHNTYCQVSTRGKYLLLYVKYKVTSYGEVT